LNLGSSNTGGAVLVVDDEEQIRKLISVGLTRAGYDVTVACSGREALVHIAEASPQLIVSDVMMPEMDGFALLAQLRSEPDTRSIPLILLTAKSSTEDVVAGLALGADDYLRKPFNMTELLARVRAKMERPPIPIDELPAQRRQSHLLPPDRFQAQLEKDVARNTSDAAPCSLACMSVPELAQLRAQLGEETSANIAQQVSTLVMADAEPLDITGPDSQDRFTLLLPNTDYEAAQTRLQNLSRRIRANEFKVDGQQIRLTPFIGYSPYISGTPTETFVKQVQMALDRAISYRDPQPTRYLHSLDPQLEQ
jgi:DNA-binding response OmpR family regulator